MKELEYPFNSDYIIKKRKLIKKELLSLSNKYLEKRIAILGGSTTNDIKLILELFLLNNGIKPIFYESEYNQYWQDAMFKNEKLKTFKPDIIFIHTTNRNIINYPNITNTKEEIDFLLNQEYEKYLLMWNKLKEEYRCTIIQNNFEYPFYRILGNKDSSDIHGKTNFIIRLNLLFAQYAESNETFFINDINYLSSLYGIDKWSDPFYYYMYKYSLNVDAIPLFCFNLSNIIKAIYGKNKKGLVLDLDNTLWGGVIGDDGVENIILGEETSEGQAYLEFQRYIKDLKEIGILLNVNSKNDEKNALLGLNRNDSVLKPDDFICIKASWDPKSKNLIDISNELNLGADSLVFVDDNPAEREIINQQIPGVVTPVMDDVCNYIKILDHNGFFEVLNISSDDLNKNQMYKENAQRNQLVSSFSDYSDYLKSLEMEAEIKDFIPLYLSRIVQLSNKSNQFNLTTKRYTQDEIEKIFLDKKIINLYGKLKDKFGDNGVVSVVIGKVNEKKLDIDLWIMSCRVLKRDMENAMLDELVKKAKEYNVEEIIGHYYPTSKNEMVKDFYDTMGFELTNTDENQNTTWKLIVADYIDKNKYIKVEDKNE